MSQYIGDLLGGKAFGDGRDGNLHITGNTTQSLTAKNCSGSASSTTLTLTSTGFTDGDILLIIQMKGTNYGKWEFRRIVSGGGTTSLTLDAGLDNTYATSGGAVAQAIKVPMYNDVTIDAGITWYGQSWDGSVGGILLFAARGVTAINGTININGNIVSAPQEGTYSNPPGGVGGGFRGGYADEANNDGNATSGQGESVSTSSYPSYGNSANYSGGGGGKYSGAPGGCGGAGGGNGASGESTSGSGYTAVGGGTTGIASLAEIVMGGGGGAGTKEPAYHGGGGGSGAGIIMAFMKNCTINPSTGYVQAIGGYGASISNDHAAGGGGAGGSILFKVYIGSFGTNRILAYGGSKGTSQFNGGDGGTGRVACQYYASISGSANPTITSAFDSKLKELSYASQVIL